jgi:hypothetical protein
MSNVHETPAERECRLQFGIRYPYLLFFEDFKECGRLTSGQGALDSPPLVVLQYFERRHGPADALDRMSRCAAAAAYWERNGEQLNVGSVSVDDETNSLLSSGLVLALWIGWCRENCDWKSYNPPVGAVIGLAEYINTRQRPAPAAERGPQTRNRTAARPSTR